MTDKFGAQYARLFGDDRRLKKAACAKALQESAWWVAHPSGPVRAPRHSERLVDGQHGYEIGFGAHAFCVERAIGRILDGLQRVVSLLAEPLSDNEKRSKQLFESIYAISRALNESVANQNGTLLYSYPISVHQGRRFLLFGAHGIEADEFYRFLFRWLDIEQYQSSLILEKTW